MQTQEEKREKARQRAKAWYEANKARAHENSRRWAEQNPEKREAIRRASQDKRRAVKQAKNRDAYEANREARNRESARYYAENKDALNEASKRWKAANPEKVKQYRQRTYQKHKDKWVAYAHERRARKQSGGGRMSPGIVAFLQRAQKGKCACCRCKIGPGNRHLDHIVPLAQGGRNDDRNAQLLCARCNLSKGARDPVEFMQSVGFLL